MRRLFGSYCHKSSCDDWPAALGQHGPEWTLRKLVFVANSSAWPETKNTSRSERRFSRGNSHVRRPSSGHAGHAAGWGVARPGLSQLRGEFLRDRTPENLATPQISSKAASTSQIVEVELVQVLQRLFGFGHWLFDGVAHALAMHAPEVAEVFADV